MAKFKSSTFGKISGKHGDVVAVTMKDGTCYFRAYILPPNPNTAKQQSQRGKFGFAVKELNCMRKLFTITFGGQYGINRAVSLAMKTCVSGEFPDFKIDYSQLQISKGSIPVPSFLEINNLTNNTFKLEWSYSELFNEKYDDNLSIVILNVTKKQMVYNQNIALRTSKVVEFTLPEYWSESEIYAWLYFSSSNNNNFSDSKYLGLITV
jgi:hypothetical protein